MDRKAFLQEVPLRSVKITDGFWKPMMEMTRTQMIPYQWRALNDEVEDAAPSHCIKNFRIAAGLEQGEFEGCVFQDSDVAKWIEAAAYSLYDCRDEALEAEIDGVVEIIGKAQQPDGYLDTYYIINGLEQRWTDLMNNHELYCAGHMLEAAVAYYEATSKRALLDIMLRYVDHIDSVMGPEEGKLHGYPGHEELELALIRLYHVTKDAKHLKLAKYFIDERGRQPLFFEQEIKKYNNRYHWAKSAFGFNYYQAGQPVRTMDKALGHAVRAVYLYTAMADVARETEDDSLYAACERLWNNIVRRQMYITGAIGASSYGETFTVDYDLPNDLVYGETCASVGMAFFAKRMLGISPRGEYADILDRLLYNGTISGMALDGKSFFYVNPLEVVPQLDREVEVYRHVKPVRQKWFGCACCPPNLARMIESIGSYIYGVRDNTVFVHLYIGNETELRTEKGGVSLCLRTGYPWNGDTELSVRAEQPVELALRIPAWAGRSAQPASANQKGSQNAVDGRGKGQAGEANDDGGCGNKTAKKAGLESAGACAAERSFTILQNGKPAVCRLQDGYAYVALPAGESKIELHFELRVRLLRANQRVREDFGRVCVQRGPVVYCLEEADNGAELHRLALAEQPNFRALQRPELLGGVTVIQADGVRCTGDDGEALYYEDDETAAGCAPCTLTFVPYYAWNNRGEGEMRVWTQRL